MWNSLIINPLTNTLHLLIGFTNDIGIAVVLFTVLIKTILLPFNISANRTTKNIKKIQPHIEKLKEKHKGDHITLGQELSKLYKEHKIKPLSGILTLFIQIPILIGLYTILKSELSTLIDKTTLFNIDVTQPSYIIAILSFISLYYLMSISTKSMTVDPNAGEFQKEFGKMMQLQMKYFLPVIMLITSIFLPAGITIYFVVSNLFGIFQYYLIERIVK